MAYCTYDKAASRMRMRRGRPRLWVTRVVTHMSPAEPEENGAGRDNPLPGREKPTFYTEEVRAGGDRLEVKVSIGDVRDTHNPSLS